MIKELKFQTTSDIDVINMTEALEAFLEHASLRDGALLIHVPGSTASVTTIEYEPGCVTDLKRTLKRLVPPGEEYAHHLAWNDGNGYSHVMAALMGPGITVPLIEGRLVLGTWQQVVLVDFDNKARKRKVLLQHFASTR